MTEDERDLDAAEHALSALPPEEVTDAAEAGRGSWDAMLAPLLAALAPVDPPASLRDRVLSEAPPMRAVSEITTLRRRVRRWRAAAMVASAAALGALLWIGADLRAPVPEGRYVAIVASDATGAPGMVVQFDIASGVATVVPLEATPPEGRSLEMWHLPVGAERPVSLGLLPSDPGARLDVSAGEGDIFAISVEPAGGSPTGQPTDARYHGTIVKVE